MTHRRAALRARRKKLVEREKEMRKKGDGLYREANRLDQRAHVLWRRSAEVVPMIAKIDAELSDGHR